jgi:hypothetical protein
MPLSAGRKIGHYEVLCLDPAAGGHGYRNDWFIDLLTSQSVLWRRLWVFRIVRFRHSESVFA